MNAPRFRMRFTPARMTVGLLALAVSVGGVVAGVASAAPARIHDIQGKSHVSPMAGQEVTEVPGIVTAAKDNGFFMQDPEPDADTATSEAVFVFTKTAPTAKVGDDVRVNGSVTEFR